MNGGPRLLSRLLCAANLALLSACARPPSTDFKLQPGDEARPELVIRKHLLGTSAEDRRIARAAYEDGERSRQREIAPALRWGPVYKALCLSAQLDPIPSVLIGCGEAGVQAVRYSDQPGPREQRLSFLSHVAMVLTSALVLDELESQLTPKQRMQTQRDRDCITEYLRDYRDRPHRPRCGPISALLGDDE